MDVFYLWRMMSRTSTVTLLYHGLSNRHHLPVPSHPSTACLPAPSHPSTAGTGIVCQHPHTPPLLFCQHPHTLLLLVCQHPHTPPQPEQALSASTLHCCHPVWPTSVYAVEWSSTHTGPHTRMKKQKCEKLGWEPLKPSVRGDRGSKASGSLSTPAPRLAWRLSGFTIE